MEKGRKGAAFDFATLPLIFDSAVYWLFRYAYLHDMEFFSNKLDTDANPVAYRTFPQRYASRMSGAQAAIIRAQLDRSDAQSQERIGKAALYDAGLKDVPEITLPPLRQDGSHTYFYYTVLARDRDGLARSMTRQYRNVQISHHRNCASLPCFAAYARPCPNAEAASREALYLPTYPGYRHDQVEAISPPFAATRGNTIDERRRHRQWRCWRLYRLCAGGARLCAYYAGCRRNIGPAAPGRPSRNCAIASPALGRPNMILFAERDDWRRRIAEEDAFRI